MKRVLLISTLMALGGLSLVLGSSVALAQELDNFSTRIALHVAPHFSPSKTYPDLCSANPINKDGLDCSQFNTTFSTNDFPGPDNYIVAGQGGSVGITGVSFGIDYDPVSVGGGGNYVNFTRCTDGLDFPNDGPNGTFPAEGGGVRVTWSTCQNSLAATGNYGVHAVVGSIYTYVYSPGSMWITPNNNVPTPELAVTDCAVATINILDVTDPTLVPQLGGRIDYGGGPGYTPCGVVNTQPTTWGKIKDRYAAESEE